MLFKGKIALITGTGRGIGRAIAQAYARQGAQALIGDSDQAGLEKTNAIIHRVHHQLLIRLQEKG
jgi:NAD(P)-dependent dehydrogenase (short-subunit alcohol dehydrogenase family)